MANSERDGDMTLARLREILAAYGAAPGRWPADERDGAHALLAASLQAREAVTEAARLDDVLDHDPAPSPSPELAGRIHRYDITAAQPGMWPRLGGWLNDSYAAFAFRPAALPAAVILATLVGLSAGLALPQLGGIKAPLPQAVVVTDDEVFTAEATLDAFAETFAETDGETLAESNDETDGETDGAGTLDEFPII